MKKMLIVLLLTGWIGVFNNTVYAQDRGWATAISWSPDGETIAVGSSTGIWFFDNEFNEIGHIEVPNIDDSPATLDWNNSGELVAFAYTSLASDVFTLIVADVDKLSVTKIIDNELITSTIRWHPTEDLILGGTYAGATYIWDALSGETVFFFEESDEDYPFYPNSTVAVCWLRDGTIGIVTYGEIYIIDIEVNQILQSIDVKFPTNADCSKDNRKIVTNGGQLVDLDSSSVEQIFTYDFMNNFVVKSIAWSPDDNRIVTNEEGCRIRVWDGESSGLLAELTGGIKKEAQVYSYFVDSIAWQPDDNRFAVVGQFGDIRVWDAETYELIQRFDGFELGYLEPYGMLNELSEEERQEIDVNNMDNCD